MKILAIGNSFSEDAERYVHQIAKADHEDVTVANLFIGGCPLSLHDENIKHNHQAYAYQLNGESVPDKTLVSIKETLLETEWDFVTMQQTSGLSGMIDTYFPYINTVYDYVKQVVPDCEIVLHETWAYEEDSTHEQFANYNHDQQTMFDALSACYKEAAKVLGNEKPLRIIPCGHAMQIARNAGLSMSRDGFHASFLHGRYLLSAVWYQFFTGHDIVGNSYCPDGLNKKELLLLQECAKRALTEL